MGNHNSSSACSLALSACVVLVMVLCLARVHCPWFRGRDHEPFVGQFWAPGCLNSRPPLMVMDDDDDDVPVDEVEEEVTATVAAPT